MQDATGFVDRGVEWIVRNLHEFELCNARNFEEELKLLKPVGELALTADVLRRAYPDKLYSVDLASWCWTELQEGKRLVRVLAVRPDLVVTITLYGCFHRLGFREAGLDRWAQYLWTSPSAIHLELPTWRRLDIEHGFETLSLSQFPNDAEKKTWLGALPEPWMITDDIAYAMTHDVFYITDFGFESDRLSARAKQYLSTWLPTWLALYARQHNWDLFAEFLMVGACIGRSTSLSRQMRQLIEAQDATGMIEGPSDSAKNLIKVDDSANRVQFLTNYHTTLVAIMAVALMERHGRAFDRSICI